MKNIYIFIYIYIYEIINKLVLNINKIKQLIYINIYNILIDEKTNLESLIEELFNLIIYLPHS